MKGKDPQKPTKPKETRQHTSVNLSNEDIAILEQEAVAAQVTVNHLMVLLLRYAAKHNRSLAQKNRRISYQKRGPEYKKVNLYLSLRDYERNQDMRRFYKMSVSLQLAYAIEHYLRQVIHDLLRKKAAGASGLNIYLSPNAYVLTERENRLLFRSIWRPFRE